MSRTKKPKPLVFRDYEIQELRKAFPAETPKLEDDLKGLFVNNYYQG